jgi:hypothetical protein
MSLNLLAAPTLALLTSTSISRPRHDRFCAATADHASRRSAERDGDRSSAAQFFGEFIEARSSGAQHEVVTT